MRTSFVALLAFALLASAPAMAGDIVLTNGQPAWHSSECVKPNPPASVLHANPETSGNDMNSLVSQHNAYVAAAQNYMNCISKEAQRDQASYDHAIVSGAQAAIADMQAAVDAAAKPLQPKPQD
ncbi:MAG: hypothetical protein KGI97_04280 [Alphaproteobacteria bacterium]|nr:hypothetical protein [Alphaproteobacteria bacterium]